MIFYHATTRDRLESILAHGLDRPCLTTCGQTLAYYAEEAAEERGESAVILGIDLPAELHGNLRVDRPSLDEPLTWAWERWASSEEAFHAMLNAGDVIAWPTDETDWQTSLDLVGAVRYEGTIPPDFLWVDGG